MAFPPRTWIPGELVTAALLNTQLRDNMAILLARTELAIGSLYINADVPTNPAVLLGYGTWAAFGSGRVLVGVDAGQPEFDTLGDTGGAKTHTLTVLEMPSHAHPGSTVALSPTGQVNAPGGPGVQNGGAEALSIASEGGDNAHNNLQPYVTVYMWRRTA